MIKEENHDLKNLLIGFGVIFLYFILNSIPYDFLMMFGINFNNLNIVIKQIYLVFYEILVTTLIIFIYRKNIISNFKDFKKNIKSYIKKYFKYWIITFALMILSNIIITLITGLNTSNNQKEINDLFKNYPIYIIVFTVFIAPILEELVFRLSFRKIFAKTNIVYIIMSGLFFGLIHVINPLDNLCNLLFIIPYSIPGFMFAYLHSKTDNIFVPISLHFIHNLFMIFIQIVLMII